MKTPEQGGELTTQLQEELKVSRPRSDFSVESLSPSVSEGELKEGMEKVMLVWGGNFRAVGTRWGRSQEGRGGMGEPVPALPPPLEHTRYLSNTGTSGRSFLPGKR